MIETIYAYILYTSDDPQKFKYFSNPFTERINHVSNIRFLEDKKIEEEFFVNILKNKSSENFEKDIIFATESIKNNIQSKNFQKARDISQKAFKEFESALQLYPFEVSHKTFINFYFWNTIAHLNNEDTAQEFLGSFLNEATLAERNALEAELTKPQYAKFAKFIEEQKKMAPVHFEIKNVEKCKVFLNGRPVAQQTFALSKTAKNVLNALCENGFYAQTVDKTSNNVITLEPHIEEYVPEMPSPQFFPIKSLENKNIQSLVFIHWSAQKHSIQTVIMNPTNFADKRELMLQLKTQDDLREAGDKIAQFLFNSPRFLIN